MNRLKELRKEKGLSQKDIANKLNISVKTISRWENLETDIKSDKAPKLADYFNVSVGYLLGYENQEQTILDSRSSPYLQKNLNFLKDLEKVKKIKTDTLVAVEFVENIISQLSQYEIDKPGSYVSEMEHISNILLDFLSDLERVENSLNK